MSTLPVTVRGNSATNSMRVGHLTWASRSRVYAMSSSAVASAPSWSVTVATGVSPGSTPRRPPLPPGEACARIEAANRSLLRAVTRPPGSCVLDSQKVDRRDLSCLMYTSGAAERPKGAMLTHDNHRGTS